MNFILYNQIRISQKMAFKIVFISLLLFSLALALEDSSHVLTLKNEDFPRVLSEFENIFVKFYAPWCGHCKQLAPIFQEVAKQFHDQNISITLAQVNAQDQKQVAAEYEIRGYPTLIYFKNGRKVEYSKERSKPVMYSWLKKQVSGAVKLLSQQQYQKITQNKPQKVTLVFHGDLSSDSGKKFEELATADAYNQYFNFKQSESNEKIEMFRSFGDKLEYTNEGLDMQQWISIFDSPSVQEVQQSTVRQLFNEGKNVIILLNEVINKKKISDPSEIWLKYFRQVAEQYISKNPGKLHFVQFKRNNKFFGKIGVMLKFKIGQTPLTITNFSNNEKYVMKFEKNGQLTKSMIQDFISSWEKGQATKQFIKKPKQQKKVEDQKQVQGSQL